MFEYIYLKFGRVGEFIRDINDYKDIIVEEDNDNLEVIALPVFSEIEEVSRSLLMMSVV